MEHRTLTASQKRIGANLLDPNTDVTRGLVYIAFVPILAMWPLLSTLPLFGLLGGPSSIGWAVMHLFLLLTGFWAVLGGWLFVKFAMPVRESAAAAPAPRRLERGLALGAYATAWTIVAMVVFMLG